MTIYTEEDLRRALADEATSTTPPIDVWPKLRRRVTVRQWERAGAAVGVAAVMAAVVIVTLPGGSNTTPMSITPGSAGTWLPNRTLTGGKLQQAVDVIRQRLDALGVAGASVRSEDGAVHLDAPGLGATMLAGIMVRGSVQIRPVFATKAPGNGAISPAAAAMTTLAAAERTYANGGCPSMAAGTDLSTPTSSYLIACSSDQSREYLLGPAAIDNAVVAHAQATQNSVTNEWLVDLEFTSAGADAFQTLTADAARKPPVGGCGPPQGCNSIGMVVDGAVLSAPLVAQRGGIRGGQTEIAGEFTKEQAQALAVVAATPPLPTGFTPARS